MVETKQLIKIGMTELYKEITDLENMRKKADDLNDKMDQAIKDYAKKTDGKTSQQILAIHKKWEADNISLATDYIGIGKQAAATINHMRNLAKKIIGLCHREGTAEAINQAEILSYLLGGLESMLPEGAVKND